MEREGRGLAEGPGEPAFGGLGGEGEVPETGGQRRWFHNGVSVLNATEAYTHKRLGAVRVTCIAPPPSSKKEKGPASPGAPPGQSPGTRYRRFHRQAIDPWEMCTCAFFWEDSPAVTHSRRSL